MKSSFKEKFRDGGKCLCDVCGKTARMGGILGPQSANPQVACYDCMMKISAEQQGISLAEARKRREKMFNTSRLFTQVKLDEYLKSAGKDAFSNLDELNMATGYVMNVWNAFDKETIEEFEKMGEEELRGIYGGVKMNFVYLINRPKIGRNDPCPCGSGEKYKKCCLIHDELEDALVAEWKKIDSAVIRKGMDLIETSAFLDTKLLIEHFWGEKRLDKAREQGVKETEEYEFNEWLMNDYYRSGEAVPFVFGGLLRQGTLTDRESLLVEARIKAPKSIWLVTLIKKGRGALLRNIFDREEIFVHDRSFSETARDGCLVPARIFSAGAYNLFSGAYVAYPLSYSQDIREMIMEEYKKYDSDDEINQFLRRHGYVFGRLEIKLREKEKVK